jgi:hypothetical protein
MIAGVETAKSWADPFGLEKIGDEVGIVYAILIVLGTIVFLIKANLLNKSTTKWKKASFYGSLFILDYEV